MENEQQAEIREVFEREVEIVRSAGGFAPTTEDLRFFGDQMAHAAIGQQPYWMAGEDCDEP